MTGPEGVNGEIVENRIVDLPGARAMGHHEYLRESGL